MTCSVVVGVEESLDLMVANRRMRANVRSRLGHCVVRVPTLDERRDEIASFALHFLDQCPAATHAPDGPRCFDPDALGLLEVATYPANLRDLREVVKAGYLRARGREEMCVEHLPEWIRAPLRYDRRMDRATKLRLAAWAVRSSSGHIRRAADRMGVHRNTMTALIQELRAAGAGLRGHGPSRQHAAEVDRIPPLNPSGPQAGRRPRHDAPAQQQVT